MEITSLKNLTKLEKILFRVGLASATTAIALTSPQYETAYNIAVASMGAGFLGSMGLKAKREIQAAIKIYKTRDDYSSDNR